MTRHSTGRTPPAVAALYAEDAVLNTPSGAFNGRQAIEGLYEHYFRDDHSKIVLTVVNELNSASGNEVRATGMWSDTFGYYRDARL